MGATTTHASIMCQENISVVTIDDERMAYEVEQYLVGLPFVENVECDFLKNEVRIEYEDEISHERILDEIEHSGCTPKERVSGIMANMKAKYTAIVE